MAVDSLRTLPEVFRNNLRKVKPSQWWKQVEDVFERKGYSRVKNTENIHTLKMANGKAQKILIDCASPKKTAIFLDGIQRCLDKNIELEGVDFVSSRAADAHYHLGFPLPFTKKAAAMYIPSDGPRIALWHGAPWNPFTRFYSLLALFNRLLFPTWGRKVYSGSPSHIIVHEIGHHLHALNLKEISRHLGLTSAEKTLVRKELGHPHFTKADGHEFVAEMFASMMGGKKFSPKLMELYHKFHGPVPPGGF